MADKKTQIPPATWVNLATTNKAESDLQKFIAETKEDFDTKLAPVVKVLNLAQEALDFASTFLGALENPLKQAFDIVISTLTSLIKDLRNIGVYLTYNDGFNRGGLKNYQAFVGKGWASAEEELVNKIRNVNDPSAPQASPQTSVITLTAFGGVEATNLIRLYELYNSVLTFIKAFSRRPVTPPNPPRLKEILPSVKSSLFENYYQDLPISRFSSAFYPDYFKVIWEDYKPPFSADSFSQRVSFALPALYYYVVVTTRKDPLLFHHKIGERLVPIKDTNGTYLTTININFVRNLDDVLSSEEVYLFLDGEPNNNRDDKIKAVESYLHLKSSEDDIVAFSESSENSAFIAISDVEAKLGTQANGFYFSVVANYTADSSGNTIKADYLPTGKKIEGLLPVPSNQVFGRKPVLPLIDFVFQIKRSLYAYVFNPTIKSLIDAQDPLVSARVDKAIGLDAKRTLLKEPDEDILKPQLEFKIETAFYYINSLSIMDSPRELSSIKKIWKTTGDEALLETDDTDLVDLVYDNRNDLSPYITGSLEEGVKDQLIQVFQKKAKTGQENWLSYRFFEDGLPAVEGFLEEVLSVATAFSKSFDSIVKALQDLIVATKAKIAKIQEFISKIKELIDLLNLLILPADLSYLITNSAGTQGFISDLRGARNKPVSNNNTAFLYASFVFVGLPKVLSDYLISLMGGQEALNKWLTGYDEEGNAIVGVGNIDRS